MGGQQIPPIGDGRPARPADVEFSFGRGADIARRARRAVAALVSGPSDPIADAVILAANELVTNVLVHTRGGGVLRVWDPKPGVPLRVEVEDGDLGQLRRRLCDPSAAGGGRGLRIVDGFANDWGVESTTHGKVVWAEFDRTRPR